MDSGLRRIQVRLINKSPHPDPSYATPLSAGCDIRVWLTEDTIINPGDILSLPTGIYLAIPEGYEAQIRSRSGLSLSHGIIMANSPGTIDADYRGEVKLIVTNISKTPFVIHDGDRIAQMVFAPVVQTEFENVQIIPDSGRSGGGFGHSGIK